MVADRLADRAGVRQLAQPVAHLLAAPHDRLERGHVVRQRRGRAARSPRRRSRSAGRAPRGSASPGRSSGRSGPRRAPRASRRSPRRAARSARGSARARSASSSSASSQPSAASGTNSWRIPSVASERRADVRVPAAERRDVLEAVLGEEAQHLQLGVRPRPRAGGRPSGRARRRRRPSVFDCSALDAAAPRSAREPRPANPSTCSNSTFPSPAVRCGLPVADQVDELARPSRERVALRPSSRPRPRDAAGRSRASPSGKRDLDERDGVRPRQLARWSTTPRAGDLARLGAVPALAGDVLDQLVLGERRRSRVTSRPSCSRNQKKPRGASVSRYGSSPIGGNARPAEHLLRHVARRTRDRSSSTACAERARLCTQRTMSSS